MFNFFTESAVWQLIAQSDFMSKLVLLGLFIQSVICCAIITYKLLCIHSQRHQLFLLVSDGRKNEKLSDFIRLAKAHRTFIGGRLFCNLFAELACVAKKPVEDIRAMSEYEFEHMVAFGNQAIDEVLLEEERYLPILGISAAVAPLIGLFGTVWGLIHAFVNISREKTADIAVVAPGIAEALMTTLAGLIVAIPALIFFHYFAQELRKTEQVLLSVTDKFMYALKRLQVYGGSDLYMYLLDDGPHNEK